MARFVPDASVTLTWCFEDEATVWSDALLDQLKAGDEAIVPALWPVEVANAVLIGVRRRRISAEKASRFFEDLRALPIHIDYQNSETTFGRVFALAAQQGLTVYDAAYLEVATRMSLPLATLDDDLKGRASLQGFLFCDREPPVRLAQSSAFEVCDGAKGHSSPECRCGQTLPAYRLIITWD
jgi:predicted nucleic acid-binding protein